MEQENDILKRYFEAAQNEPVSPSLENIDQMLEVQGAGASSAPAGSSVALKSLLIALGAIGVIVTIVWLATGNEEPNQASNTSPLISDQSVVISDTSNTEQGGAPPVDTLLVTTDIVPSTIDMAPSTTDFDTVHTVPATTKVVLAETPETKKDTGSLIIIKKTTPPPADPISLPASYFPTPKEDSVGKACDCDEPEEVPSVEYQTVIYGDASNKQLKQIEQEVHNRGYQLELKKVKYKRGRIRHMKILVYDLNDEDKPKNDRCKLYEIEYDHPFDSLTFVWRYDLQGVPIKFYAVMTNFTLAAQPCHQ